MDSLLDTCILVFLILLSLIGLLVSCVGVLEVLLGVLEVLRLAGTGRSRRPKER